MFVKPRAHQIVQRIAIGPGYFPGVAAMAVGRSRTTPSIAFFSIEREDFLALFGEAIPRISAARLGARCPGDA